MQSTIIILAVICFQLLAETMSCGGLEAEPEKTADGYTIYTIPTGSHSSSTVTKNLTKEELSFMVRFDSSAIYKTVQASNEGDINKLYGFNDCESNAENHSESARFGWRYYYKELQLFSYCYKGGNRVTQFLKTIEINKSYSCSIKIADSVYIFSIDKKNLDTVSRGCSGVGQTKYRLYPFFGGDEPAPHEIKVYIKEL